MPNKVRYNLKNCHYAKLTLGADNAPSYDTPVPIPGAVSLNLSANGEPENFYADGIVYYVMNNNMGYEGDLEIALVPESFRTDILKEALDANGVLIEDSTVTPESFALLFEFDGDKKHIRHVLYNCSASRPAIEGETTTDTKEVKTESLSIKAAPLPSGKVKAKTGDSTADATYSGWYNAVYMPASTSEDTTLANLAIAGAELTPAFSASVRSYACETSAASAVVTATANDADASVTILVNGEAVASGGTASFSEGENGVVAVVTNGAAATTYSVVVTRSAG